MKKILLTLIMLLWTSFMIAQSWNPYVSQGIISPAPLTSVKQNGAGTISFNVGNTGSSPLPFDRNVVGNNLFVVISLSGGVPDVNPLNPQNASTAINGTWARMFTWLYDEVRNSFTGKQNQPIPGQNQGNITIRYKVSEDSQLNAPKNGFKVVCIPPPYCQATNSTNDDQVSSYTCTEDKSSGNIPK